jgi:PncC family amidohydrolase
MSDPYYEVGQLLRFRGLSLSLAESCTGGILSHQITEVPGSSGYYRGCIVAYHDQVKEQVLGVKGATLRAHGAVSEQAAREMAEGARRVLVADLGLATTGIAGPGGGTPDKPVGLVFIALAAPTGTWCEQHVWGGGRSENKVSSAAAALDLLRRYLNGWLPQSAPANHAPE